MPTTHDEDVEILSGAQVLALALACPQVAEELDIASEKPLGCGAQGCVLRRHDALVVKITQERREAALAGWMRATSARDRIPGLPHVEDVVALPARCGPVPLWAIVREDLADFSVTLRAAAEKHLKPGTEAVNISVKFVQIAFDSFLRDMEAGLPAPAALKTLDNDLADSRLTRLPKAEFLRAARSMADTMAALAAEGIDLGDLKQSNWGARAGTLEPVLRDFGVVHRQTRGAPVLRQLAGSWAPAPGLDLD